MRTGTDFGRILDEKLEHTGWTRAAQAAASRPAAARWRPGPQPVFLFELRPGFTAVPPRPAATSDAPAWTPVYGARPGAQARRSTSQPARRVTAAQRAALEVLHALGARGLHDDCTDAELRSAFRGLARRFHPDRHPGCSDQERARLARDFAAACDAYRTLTNPVH